MRKSFVIPVLLCTALIGCVEQTRPIAEAILPNQTHNLNGTITIGLGDFSRQYVNIVGQECGQTQSSIVNTETPVTIKDGSGKVLGVTRLQPGVVTLVTQTTPHDTVCVFPFQIKNVPVTDFYSVEAGNKGSITYSKADLEQKKWTLRLEL